MKTDVNCFEFCNNSVCKSTEENKCYINQNRYECLENTVCDDA